MEKLDQLKKAATAKGLISDGWHRDGGLAVWIDGKWTSWLPEDCDSTAKYRPFRVYVAQVNAAVIEVEARNEEEAREMAASKWRSDYAIPRVKNVEAIASLVSEASPAA